MKASLCHYWHTVAAVSFSHAGTHPFAFVVALNPVPLPGYALMMPHFHADSTAWVIRKQMYSLLLYPYMCMVGQFAAILLGYCMVKHYKQVGQKS